jgi:acetyl-CoA acetyltransferase
VSPPEAAVVGIAETVPTKRTELSYLELVAQVARDALRDATLLPSDVDGLLVAPTMVGANLTLPAHTAEYLGLRLGYCDLVDLGGATAVGMVWRAAAAIQAGACEVVLCVLAEPVGPMGADRPMNWRGTPRGEFEEPTGQAGTVSAYALAADRHATEFGTTPEQRAQVVVAQRRNAAQVGVGMLSAPIEVADVLASPMICSPLHLLEIVRPASGAAAFVVASPRVAERLGARHAWLRGFGECVTHAGISAMPDLVRTPIEESARKAFASARVRPADIAVAEVYDCYSITVILTLEDAGFVPKGKGGSFVEAGDFGPGAVLPVNTNGGQLCLGQAGVAGGATHLVQAVRQLRGAAGAVQVPECDLAFVHGNGGRLSEQCSLILGAQRS